MKNIPLFGFYFPKYFPLVLIFLFIFNFLNLYGFLNRQINDIFKTRLFMF